MENAKEKENKTIVVAGDIAVDVLEEVIPPKRDNSNWQSYTGLKSYKRRGGVLLLADLVKAATDAKVYTHKVDNLEDLSSEDHIYSYSRLGKFKDDNGNISLRVAESRGFSGPESSLPAYPALERDDAKADLVVIDDAGNGYNDFEENWPKALNKDSDPVVVYKMSYPLMKGALWRKLKKDHNDKLVTVVSADDLRKFGVKISRRLSWERTAQELVWQLTSNSKLYPLHQSEWLIVRFGPDGFLLFKNKNGEQYSKLFFDPNMGENIFAELFPGRMQGLNSAFTASLSAHILEKGLENIEKGMKGVLAAARLYWKTGFIMDPKSGEPEYPTSEVFKPSGKEISRIAVTDVPRILLGQKDVPYWCILDDARKHSLEKVATELVLTGKSEALDAVPLGKFNFLETFDREEIESFSSIKNLIKEYVNSPEQKKPISFAVFGAPGSGKSFGVEQVAECIAPGKIKPVEFNMSQFGSVDELISALHVVRDISLGNKLPLVFFDEFDSEFGNKLGWLKYFLAPMQDGKFKEGDTVHPIGRAIFVFAGGTCHNFEEFSKKDVLNSATGLNFKDVKGPDFVSRLRGFIDIKGPNPLDENDKVYIIRRALILRNLFLRSVKNIVDGKKVRIDKDLLRALLRVRKFRHGIRSIVSILDMSLTAGMDRFEQSALPSEDQLDLHVDAKEFLKLMSGDVYLGDNLAAIALSIHENYRTNKKERLKNKYPSDNAKIEEEILKDDNMRSWEDLAESYKASNIDQAQHITVKLKEINCSFRPNRQDEGHDFEFKNGEVERLAILEHQRWLEERVASGWTLGPKDEKKKTSPFLVQWDEMDNIDPSLFPPYVKNIEEIKDYDRDAVKNMPDYLWAAGFEIYRLDE